LAGLVARGAGEVGLSASVEKLDRFNFLIREDGQGVVGAFEDVRDIHWLRCALRRFVHWGL
jgi:hypothetical protein